MCAVANDLVGCFATVTVKLHEIEVVGVLGHYAMIEAGATRLGASASVAIAKGLAEIQHG